MQAMQAQMLAYLDLAKRLQRPQQQPKGDFAGTTNHADMQPSVLAAPCAITCLQQAEDVLEAQHDNSAGTQTEECCLQTVLQQAHTEMFQLSDCGTQTKPCQQHLVTQDTQTAYHQLQQVSNHTQTELSVQLLASAQTQTFIPLMQGTSSQTQDALPLPQRTQQTQTKLCVSHPASSQTALPEQLATAAQTCMLSQHDSATQAAASLADAACQCVSEQEVVKAAQDRIGEMQGQLIGLQLKVSSLQGIVNIQEQQLLAAAGHPNDQASTFELLLVWHNTWMENHSRMRVTLKCSQALPLQ